MSEEIEKLAAEQEADLKAAEAEKESLGVPDFSSIMDDDEAEITNTDLANNEPKAKKGLKASYAIKKLMPMAFGVVARVKGEHWLLDDAEVDEFAEAVDDCMEHYFPDVGGLPPWAMLAFVSGSIVLPRLMMDSMSEEDAAEIQAQLSAPNKDELLSQPGKPVGHGTVLRAKGVNDGS